MNYDYKLKYMQDQIDQLKDDYEKSMQFTNAILKKAEEYGIKNLGINKTSELVQDNPWLSAPPSLFAKEEDNNGWPVVWKLAQDFFKGSCGNGQQYQIPGNALVVDGIYSYKNGKWTRVE